MHCFNFRRLLNYQAEPSSWQWCCPVKLNSLIVIYPKGVSVYCVVPWRRPADRWIAPDLVSLCIARSCRRQCRRGPIWFVIHTPLLQSDCLGLLDFGPLELRWCCLWHLVYLFADFYSRCWICWKLYGHSELVWKGSISNSSCWCCDPSNSNACLWWHPSSLRPWKLHLWYGSLAGASC